MEMAEHILPENEIPLVDIAIAKILERFEADGYDTTFSHEEMHHWLGIEMAEEGKREILKKEQLDYMTGICKIKDELLDNYNLCLHSKTCFGYEILHPSAQIQKGADAHMRKAQKALTRHAKILVNTDISELSDEEKNLQLNKMNRIAFIKAAFRKKKLPGKAKAKEIT